MQRLFIAEKPSLGRAIAEGLGKGQARDGYIICGNDVVTWCFGHVLEQYEPEDYDPQLKVWRRDTLPIIPQQWKNKPKEAAKKQLAILGNLLKQASSAVNAGDPDREGQLLVDEVLEYFHYQGPVQRIWLASLDARSVSKALSNLKNNADYAPLRDAARARSRADWLIGMNATRAMSILGKECGRKGVLSLGRVQTPTLALVVERDRKIARFKPIDYFVLQALLDHEAGQFTATFVPSDTQPGLDSDGRLVDSAAAAALVEKVHGVEGHIREVTREKKKKAAPLPHCLSSLQKAASARLNMTAQQVLDTAQSLYEKKLTTYPRTDCRYLPVEQFTDASRILSTLSGSSNLAQIAGNADPSLRGPVWDTGKITAHHAIIPTGQIPGSLTKQELALYLMIATAYCLQFYPPMQYESQKISVNLKSTQWEARGRRILDPGWTRFVGEEDDDAKDKDQSLPVVKEKDSVTCSNVETLKKKTTPPPRLSEGSLIEAMANIHRFVEDSRAKATLKENEGIGTEATRAGILETLKNRGYLKAEGKTLVSTALGREVIEMTPEVLKDPVTTAQWESLLESVAAGKATLTQFMTQQSGILPQLLTPFLSAKPKLIQGAFPCPVCGKALHRKEGQRGHFWFCTGYPECKTTLPDDKGKPGKRETPVKSDFPCPVCGQPLYQRTNDKGPYWACFNKEAHPDGKPVFLPDDDGKPGTPKEKKPQDLTEFKCPKCGKPLAYRKGIGRNEKPYELFSCSGFPKCKESFFGKDGKPDFEGKKK